MQRLGLDAWFAVVSSREWTPAAHGHDESFGQGDIYLEVSPGIERIHIDGTDAYARRDLAFGIGAGGGGRRSRRSPLFGGFIEVRATFASGEPTPPEALETTTRCSSACAAPVNRGIDVGLALQIGLLLGS
jgi:hypothetical protein